MSDLVRDGTEQREPLPYGWFQVGYLDDFPRSVAMPLMYFGRHLVGWRDGNGVNIGDAFCPHLGTHLGYGGRVVDDCLRCPFHGWEFGSGGECRRVPYSNHLPRVGIRTYPVALLGNLCFVWFHPDPDVPPAWDLPDLPEIAAPDPTATAAPRYRRRVTMRWQDVGENACDVAHFSLLHGTGEVSDVRIAQEGPYRRLTMRTPLSAEGDVVEASWSTEHHGPGVIVNRVDVAGVSILNVTAISPIDGRDVDYRMSWAPVPDKGTDRRTNLVARLFIRRMMSNSDQDIVIFENKIYHKRPRIVPEDSNVLDYRRWVGQFLDHATAGGRVLIDSTI
jgi:nitrite reductase/ring-hydroxylating ferredoxin subunit